MKANVLKTNVECRTPHGVRGLKFNLFLRKMWARWSHPSRGAWIEIRDLCDQELSDPSHPSRGAWIEIARPPATSGRICVAPLTGCVD